jgi:predicted dehydrogenase
MALRVVIAGLGSRGRDWVREVRAAADCELVGCVDSDEQTLRNSSASLGIDPARAFVRLEEALDQLACDVVIVATAADEHVHVCKTALEKRFAVLVEKPFTLHLQEAADLVSLAEVKNTPLLVAQNYRYLRSFRTVKRLVSDGTLGNVGTVVCQYYRSPHHMAASLSKLEHSVLWGVGVHHLDALRYVLGQEVTGVTSESYTLPWGDLPTGASLRLLLTFDGNTRGFYSATYESTGHEFFERGQEFYARFVGEKATLHVFQRWLILCQEGKLPRLVRRGHREITEEQVLLKQLARAISHGETAEVSGSDNLQTMAILEACVRSSVEQRTINPQQLLKELNKNGNKNPGIGDWC